MPPSRIANSARFTTVQAESGIPTEHANQQNVGLRADGTPCIHYVHFLFSPQLAWCPFAGKQMDEDVKFDEDAKLGIDRAEVADEAPVIAVTTKRPRVRMKKRKKGPAVARLTTTPSSSSSTPLGETTVPSEQLPMEHRFGQGIDLESADVVKEDIELTVKNAKVRKQRVRTRNRIRNQDGVAGAGAGGGPKSDGVKQGNEEDVIKLKWRNGGAPPHMETTGNARRRIKYREEHPVIVCDDPNNCPTPIYDNPPAVYEFGGKKKKKKKQANKIIPPAYNVKQISGGKRPLDNEGQRRFKPFMRKKGPPGMRRRNNTMQIDQVVVPQRLRVKDVAKDDFAKVSRTRKKTMRRKMRPVAGRVTSTAATTAAEEHGSESGMRQMRPFRRRRPTTSPSAAVMDGGGVGVLGEDLQVAEETTTQHVPLDMVLMRDMSLPELQQFMADKVKEMNKKMKRVFKGQMEEAKGDSMAVSRPRMKDATPAPTALASTTSYPAVPKMDLMRTTSRAKTADEKSKNGGAGSGVLFRDQLRVRSVDT